ncbi:hypothetical protein Lbir_2784 [Legionella birminghamensis]|uniref:Uncharacterized protein n=1 Tax=Legionella birminghamensis TaxID=28083 RepID=A0A378I7A7_9GAMM|nr:hypothetical protein [Legionella birminghamensis]KTC68182.1 hypothetical protein Lbir_2784 [Legionella birminghamensis]STX31108.1 Uncharacterised protein [Legionella birminghamensis]
MAKFRNLSGEQLQKKLQRDNVDCNPISTGMFYKIVPVKDKKMPLKSLYKNQTSDLFLAGVNNLRNEHMPRIVDALTKLKTNGILERPPESNTGAALKFHVNINSIANLDEKVLWGLIDLLNKKAKANNNMNFDFKIVNPEEHGNNRFKDTDQLTIYFDAYSSVSDMLALSEDINNYLQANLTENKTPLGPNDKFGFNSFVSVRFDTCRATTGYAVYSFFDNELAKFFEKYQAEPQVLSNLPACAFEAVFNNVIFSKQITDLNFQNGEALSPRDSAIVQNEFVKMLKNPYDYIAGSPKICQEGRDLFSSVQDFSYDFSQLNNTLGVEKHLEIELQRLACLGLPEELVAAKKEEMKLAAEARYNEIKANAGKLNDSQGKFEQSLQEIAMSVKALEKSDPKAAKDANNFYKAVIIKYHEFKKTGDLSEFKNFCQQRIKYYNDSENSNLAGKASWKQILLKILPFLNRLDYFSSKQKQSETTENKSTSIVGMNKFKKALLAFKQESIPAAKEMDSAKVSSELKLN